MITELWIFLHYILSTNCITGMVQTLRTDQGNKVLAITGLQSTESQNAVFPKDKWTVEFEFKA